MCGIAGIYFTDGTPADGRRTIERLTTTLAHRGPDDCGYHVDRKAVLGHRRLSIIDLSGGQQPIYNEDQTVCVVFNGEIYNFQDIRTRLLADGHVFRTNSDTETIVHAYEAWGDRCVEKFRGMFAFALRDQRNDRVLLARDRFGKKPMFYAQYDGKFVFASEMKAILDDSRFDRRLDEEALASYFMLSYIPAPLTIFRGIRKMLPGHVLTIEHGRPRQTRYWHLSFRPNRRRREADFIEEFKARMADAVRMRLMSEVPLGAFLSGGIDSSAVVAFMARASETPVNTFTIGFTGDTGSFDDERKYARMVAERYRTNHRELRGAAARDRRHRCDRAKLRRAVCRRLDGALLLRVQVGARAGDSGALGAWRRRGFLRLRAVSRVPTEPVLQSAARLVPLASGAPTGERAGRAGWRWCPHQPSETFRAFE